MRNYSLVLFPFFGVAFEGSAPAQPTRCVAPDAQIESSATMPAFVQPDPLIRPGTVTLEWGTQAKIKGWNNAEIKGLSRFGYAVLTACDQTVSWNFQPFADGRKGVEMKNLRVSSGKSELMEKLPEAAQFAATSGAMSAELAGLVVAAIPTGPAKYDIVAVRSANSVSEEFKSVATLTRIATVNAELSAISQSTNVHGGRAIQFVTKPDSVGQIGIFRIIYFPLLEEAAETE